MDFGAYALGPAYDFTLTPHSFHTHCVVRTIVNTALTCKNHDRVYYRTRTLELLPLQVIVKKMLDLRRQTISKIAENSRMQILRSHG